MFIKLIAENFKSFDQREELSMITSNKVQGNKTHYVKAKQTHLLKNAVIYGANASGKSNLVSVFTFFQQILTEGFSHSFSNEYCCNKIDNNARESFFEIQFTIDDKFYAYGFCHY